MPTWGQDIEKAKKILEPGTVEVPENKKHFVSWLDDLKKNSFN